MPTINLILTLFATASLGAWAMPPEQKNFKFTCITEFPTTSFIGEQEGDKLNLRVIHHNGVKYLPLYTTTITPNDIDDLKTQAELLSNLGDRIEVSFPMEKCEFYGSAIFACLGGGTIVKNGVEYEVFSLNSSYTTNYFQQHEFERREMMLSFFINGTHRAIAMPYDLGRCEFENEPEKNRDLTQK